MPRTLFALFCCLSLIQSALAQESSPTGDSISDGAYVAYEEPIAIGQMDLVPASEARRSDSIAELGFQFPTSNSSTNTVGVGQQFDVKATFRNDFANPTFGGPLNAINVQMTLSFDATFQPDGFSGHDYFQNCSFTSTQMICTAPSVPAGVVETIVVPFTGQNGGTYTFTLTVTHNNDPDQSNNTATQQVEVTSGPFVSGTLGEDLAGDGSLGEGDPGIPGECLCIDSDQDGTCEQSEPTETTDSNGSFRFGPIQESFIRIRPCDFVSSTNYITIWPSAGYRDISLSGADVVDMNFGAFVPGILRFQKKEDGNADGLDNQSDTGIDQWRAHLTVGQNNPALFVNSNSSTTTSLLTDSQGLATFTELGPGAVVLSEDMPEGWTQSSPGGSGTTSYTITSRFDQSVTYLNWRQPFPTTVILLNDLNANSEVNDGEPGIPGQVYWIDLDGDKTQDDGEPNGTTDSNGSVTLQSPSLGQHNICTSSSSSLIFYQPTVVSGTSCRLITYQSSSPSTTLYWYASSVTSTASAFVYVDQDGSGTRTTGEPAAEGAEVNLERVEQNGNVHVSTMIMTTQSVIFTNLQPGTYRMYTSIRLGWSRLIPANGEHIFTITNPGENVSFEFGEYQPGRITGWKFRDNDGDGDEEDGDGPIEGVTIGLAKASSAAGPYSSVSTATTAIPVGQTRATYTFSNLPPGFYRISEIVPTGFTQTRPTEGNNQFAHAEFGANAYFIQLGSGQQFTGMTFGNRPPIPVIIDGYKYVDINGDGELTAGEPRLNGVTLQLKQGGVVIASAVTQDRDLNNDETIDPATERGWFVFDAQPDGEYELSELVPAGMQITQPAGNAYTVTVTAGQDLPPFVFGNSYTALDWGDLPDPRTDLSSDCPRGEPINCYRTLSGVMGPAHVVTETGVRLGQRIDAESDGQPNAPALGDDDNISSQGGVDDEDGLKSFEVDGTGKITLTIDVSGEGLLDAYADINDDGVLNDGVLAESPLEAIFSSTPVVNGINILETPEGRVAAYADIKYIRLRVSSAGGLGAGGLALDGEVEDYRVHVRRPQAVNSSNDTGDANPGDGMCGDADGVCTLRAAIEEANASGQPFRLTFGSGSGKRNTVVTPTSPLPAFQVPIIVEGNDELEIDGSMAGADAHGLTIGAGGSQISGVLIHSFSGDGIRITSGQGSSISASTLRNNEGNGVTVLSGNGNRVRQSAVYANGGLGIDLGGDGITLNDVDDADTGANQLMNYPELSLVTAENGRVEGSVFVTAGGTTTVDLFANAAGCDSSGNGQGQSYVGSVDVSSIGGGSTSFSVDLPNPLAIGDVLTATATDRDGNTSEFSSCFVAVTTNVERTDAGVLPQTFELGQNYPNPFNPVTTIGFQVSSAEHVRIEVFDILGKRVAGLVDRFMEPGAYRVSFDAEDLPSGTYVYTMQAGTFRATKTLILLK